MAKQREWEGSYESGGELSVECQAGDELLLTFSCRDQNGLGYEFFLYGWRLTEEGVPEYFAPAWDWPKLTWN